jgi:hypothetical protein
LNHLTPVYTNAQAGLSAVAESIAQKIVQIRDIVDLADGRFFVVFDAPECELVAVQGHVGRPGVPVSRLTYRSHIDQNFLCAKLVLKIQLFRTEEIQAFGEDARHMRVSLKTILIDQREDLFHLSLIINVFREDIFVQRIPCGTVNEQELSFTKGTGPFAKKFPAEFVSLRIAGFELLPSPENCPFRWRIESFGVEQGPLIVITQQRHAAIGHYQINALARIWAVANNIPQAIDLFDALLFDIREHGLQCLEIPVDVAYKRFQGSVAFQALSISVDRISIFQVTRGCKVCDKTHFYHIVYKSKTECFKSD